MLRRCAWMVTSLLPACGSGSLTGETVLASVGPTAITLAQLDHFERRLPRALRTTKRGYDGKRDHLQTLIDKEVYLLEARRRDLDESPGVQRPLQAYRDEIVIRALLDREVVASIEVDDEELAAYQPESGRHREFTGRQIVVATREEAREIVRLLEEGALFEDLARARSLHLETAKHGGEIRYFTGVDGVLPGYQSEFTKLSPGEISDPVRLPNGFHTVFQLTEERPVELARVRSVLESELIRRKALDGAARLAEQLASELRVQRVPGGLANLAGLLREHGRELPAPERQTVLYDFDGGQVTAGTFVDVSRDLGISISAEDGKLIESFAEQTVLSRALYIAAAERAGIHETPEIVERLRRKEQALLLLALRRVALHEAVTVDEQEARAFYVRHPDRFTLQSNIEIQEILVATAIEAVALKDLVEAGASMDSLAALHTLRSAARIDGGRFHIHPYERALHTDLIAAAQEAEVGELVGPTRVRVAASDIWTPLAVNSAGTYHAVFRLLGAVRSEDLQPFPEVRKRAVAMVRKQKERQLGDRFLLQLRQQYADDVTVHEDVLHAVADL